MSTRPLMVVLLLGSMLAGVGCDVAPFDYYPHHETAVACGDVHKNTDPGSYGGTDTRFISSTAGTNPATGPAKAAGK